MVLFKIGESFSNGNKRDIYILQGNCGGDGERRAAKDQVLGTVGVACGTREDGSTIWVQLAGWRERMPEVAALKKGDSVLAIGSMRSRMYNDKPYLDFSVDFLAVSGKSISAPKAAAAVTKFQQIPAEAEEVDGDLPF